MKSLTVVGRRTGGSRCSKKLDLAVHEATYNAGPNRFNVASAGTLIIQLVLFIRHETHSGFWLFYAISG